MFTLTDMILSFSVVHSSPWVFEEIKPVKVFSVKKSSLPDAPVKEIDPSMNHNNIKQDIQKLLDFLGAGPLDDGKKSNALNQEPTLSRTNTTQEDQHKETPTKPD